MKKRKELVRKSKDQQLTIRRCELKKGVKRQQGRLRNLNGELVSSEQRAETLAEHLEKVQWAVRPISATRPTERIGDELPVKIGAVTLEEEKGSVVTCVLAEPWKT